MARRKLYELFDQLADHERMTRVYIGLGERVDQTKIKEIVEWLNMNIRGDWGYIEGKYPEFGGQRHLKLNFCKPGDAVMTKLVWG